MFVIPWVGLVPVPILVPPVLVDDAEGSAILDHIPDLQSMNILATLKRSLSSFCRRSRSRSPAKRYSRSPKRTPSYSKSPSGSRSPSPKYR